jgi:phosphoenolpyruvate-protein phosphotransferase (PTS system enzyme I)
MKQMKIFKGASLSPGKSHAPVCMYSSHLHHAVTEYDLKNDEEILRELDRFEASLSAVAGDLEKAGRDVSEKIGKAESEIFLAQKHIMMDPSVLERVKGHIRTKRKNAEHAVSEVYKEFESGFEKMLDEYLKERARDIADIRRRLLDQLKEVSPGFVCKGQLHCRRGVGRVIVTEELSPNMIVNTDFTKVKGFVTEHGGSASHAAIIARALGIPAVSGIHGIMESVACGDEILVDGDSGTVYLHPEALLLKELLPPEGPHAAGAALQKTPKGMEVMANASIPEEIGVIREADADGIGLFRTEFLFIKAGRALTEEEQYAIYSGIASKMEGRPVTFRLLDVGGDKPLPFLSMEPEANPYLGWRGSRFLLGQPGLFATQIRALVRAAAHGKIRILFPMVIDLAQWRRLKSLAEEAISRVNPAGARPPLGVMFEVPSACLQARDILDEADFGSIGSNDLVQYLFAVDRNNEHVALDYNPDHPVFW